jgi:hypothetical protein
MTFGKVGAPRLLVLQPNHRTRCHTIVSTCERLRGVIERDWGRQLAQKRHNLPASQNRPSGPWVEPHSPSRWKHFRKGTKRRVSRAQPRFVPLVFGSHSQDRSPPQRLPPTRCAARFHAASPSHPNLSLRSCVHPGDASRFWFHRRAVPQKSRCATSQPRRTSDTSPFALLRKVKPQKKNVSF